MDEESAIVYLKERLSTGASIVAAARADFRSIRQLQNECLDADIPAMIGPCEKGG